MQKEFILLEETIKLICGRGPVYYFANPGNLGDALIRYGTIKFFRQTGIKYKELRIENSKIEWLIPVMRGGTLIYGGGGAWCKLWNFSRRILAKKHKYFKNIVILPSSYEISWSIPNATYFCRDFYDSKKNRPKAIFCHDMAFYIGRISATKGTETGYFFRKDKESANKIEIPPENNDLSYKGNHFSDVYPFFEELAKYSVIHTDRLHVAIASCLLGKELHLYPGSYFKNRAVYMSSMKDCFENVYFHEDFDF